ncbi:MAG: TlpA family protein disulfide reductase [Planctomycetes bacterium]|nr:TlpA family protein disulfide reductase [Planctomycetota bacterium]
MQYRMWMIPVAVLCALLLVAGCRNTAAKGNSESNACSGDNTKPENKPPENKAPENTEPEIDPETGEVCLLPPTAQPDDLGGLLKVGETAPEITLTDTRTGKDVKLSEMKGRTVLLFFWASWCPTCKMACRTNGSLWKMMKVIDESPESNVMILGIGTGSDDNADSQKAFLDSNECTWTSTFDAGNKVEEKYGVLGVPTAVVVGSDGKILTFGRYERDWRDRLLEYLKQECVQKPEGK